MTRVTTYRERFGGRKKPPTLAKPNRQVGAIAAQPLAFGAQAALNLSAANTRKLLCLQHLRPVALREKADLSAQVGWADWAIDSGVGSAMIAAAGGMAAVRRLTTRPLTGN